jgi:hypothetical protein
MPSPGFWLVSASSGFSCTLLLPYRVLSANNRYQQANTMRNMVQYQTIMPCAPTQHND